MNTTRRSVVGTATFPVLCVRAAWAPLCLRNRVSVDHSWRTNEPRVLVSQKGSLQSVERRVRSPLEVWRFDFKRIHYKSFEHFWVCLIPFCFPMAPWRIFFRSHPASDRLDRKPLRGQCEQTASEGPPSLLSGQPPFWRHEITMVSKVSFAAYPIHR